MFVKITIVTIFIIGCTQGAPCNPESTGDSCISNCDSLRDGNYQSCEGCHVFASCAGGRLYDNRACPANLVWDDNLKRCEYTSATCSEDVTAVSSNYIQKYLQENLVRAQKFGDRCTLSCSFRPINCEITCEDDDTNGNCLSDCSGVPDGDYQSCQGCNVYATCTNELLIDNRPCPADLVWDDNQKRCQVTSTSCSRVVASSGDCVSSCQGMPNGDFQSCQGCHVYASCAHEVLYDNRPCPANLVWDDNLKRCEYVSSTCSEESSGTSSSSSNNNNNNNNVPVVEGADTGDSCISSCEGLLDGDYQSCEGCSVYASCSNGGIVDNRPCPGGLVWDDTLKQCAVTSSTCTEPEGSGSVSVVF